MHQHGLEADRLESSFTEVALGVLVDHEAATPPAAREANSSSIVRRSRKVILPLSSAPVRLYLEWVLQYKRDTDTLE